MKHTLALVLMVFGLVGCATTTDGKLVTSFAMQASHNVPWWAGEKIVASYDDITLKHKALAINRETNEEFFYALPYEDSDSEILPYSNKNVRESAFQLCEYYAKPYGMFEYVDGTPEVCFIDRLGDAKYEGTHNKKNGEFHGRGTLTFANGDRYEGGFINGKLNGRGTMSWADGKELSGTFYNDKLVEPETITNCRPQDVPKDSLNQNLPECSEGIISNMSESNFLVDVVTTTGQIILGGLYIAVAIAGSPEALEYQENKNQKAKEEAAYKKGKRDGAIRAERKKSEQCVLTRSC